MAPSGSAILSTDPALRANAWNMHDNLVQTKIRYL